MLTGWGFQPCGPEKRRLFKVAAAFIINAMLGFFRRLDVGAECASSGLGLWSCPPFLFVVIGLVNITGILSSYFLAAKFAVEPEAVVLLVSLVAISIFIIGHSVIRGFTKVAEANRFKSEFIAIISHQLRSPLSIFKWSLDAINHNRGDNPDFKGKAEPYLKILGENAERMNALVNTLLEVSRIETGSLVLRPEPIRLDVLAEEVAHSFRAYAQASNVVLDYAAPAAIPAVRGDREKAKMVLENLVDNAIRYSPGGRVVMSIAPVDSFWVECRVGDNGLGIPENQQRLVFQKFFRSTNASSREVRGWGLGLYVARSIIEALQGKIGFQSREGQGSLFWFRLPVYRK